MLDPNIFTSKELTLKFGSENTTFESGGVRLTELTYTDHKKRLSGFGIQVGSKNKEGVFSVKSEATARETFIFPSGDLFLIQPDFERTILTMYTFPRFIPSHFLLTISCP